MRRSKSLKSFTSFVWDKRFPEINVLMNLVNEIGWFAATQKMPVTYRGGFLTTIQEYMVKGYVFGSMIERERKNIKYHYLCLLLRGTV